MKLVSFNEPIINWMHANHPDVPYFHLDNHSDALSQHYALELLKRQETHVLFVIILETTSATRMIPKYLQAIIAARKETQIISLGNSPLYDKVQPHVNIQVMEEFDPLIRKIDLWINENRRNQPHAEN
jgi:hypothetical protein